MRKIVQIAFDTYSRGDDVSDITSGSYALLDNGDVWCNYGNGWEESTQFNKLINLINKEEENENINNTNTSSDSTKPL